jgi:hypothetical protein
MSEAVLAQPARESTYDAWAVFCPDGTSFYIAGFLISDKSRMPDSHARVETFADGSASVASSIADDWHAESDRNSGHISQSAWCNVEAENG